MNIIRGPLQVAVILLCMCVCLCVIIWKHNLHNCHFLLMSLPLKQKKGLCEILMCVSDISNIVTFIFPLFLYNCLHSVLNKRIAMGLWSPRLQCFYNLSLFYLKIYVLQFPHKVNWDNLHYSSQTLICYRSMHLLMICSFKKQNTASRWQEVCWIFKRIYLIKINFRLNYSLL